MHQRCAEARRKTLDCGNKNSDCFRQNVHERLWNNPIKPSHRAFLELLPPGIHFCFHRHHDHGTSVNFLHGKWRQHPCKLNGCRTSSFHGGSRRDRFHGEASGASMEVGHILFLCATNFHGTSRSNQLAWKHTNVHGSVFRD